MFKGYSCAAALLGLAFFTQGANAAPACAAISIAPATTLSSGTAGVAYGPVTFTASGSSATPYNYDISSGLPVGSGLSIGPSNGQLSGTPTTAGNFLMTVTASDANGCTGGRTYALDVGVGNQTITFTSLPPGTAAVNGPTYNVTATATSGLPVAFSIDATATSVCSISGSTVSFLTAGSCVIDADQAGNASFNTAPQVKQTFAVGKGNQTITFTSVPPTNPPIGGPTYNVTATASSGLPVTFTIDATATSVCSIAGNTVSFTGSGNCVIDADQAGNANYNAAPQAQQSFGVAKKAQTIAFTSTAPAGAKVGGPTYDVTATATSGLPVTFTIDAISTGVCSIAGSTVSFMGVGTCQIDANQAGDATYGAAPQVTQSFLVGKGDQTITFTSTAPGSAAVGGATYNVTATATSGLPVTLAIDVTSTSVCSIAGSTISFTGVGTCQIDANQAGNANYNAAAQATQSFAVAKGNQTISFTSSPPASPTVGGATYNVTATSTSGLPVAFTIDATSTSVCSIAGSTVSFIGAGTCQIDANQGGNANYNAAPQALQSFLVGKGNQTITFTSTAPVNPQVGGATYNVMATATSALAVTFTIDPTATSVCSIAGSTVSFIGSGSCVIDADQAGDANWNAAPQAKQTFGVNKQNQTITFTSTAPVGAAVGGATYTVGATATSGLAVTFTIDPTATSVCAIAGSTVSFIGTGSCVIDADQAGDTTYNAAPQVKQTFTVGKGSQTISFTSTQPAGATVGGPTYTVTATATSGLPVTFTINAVSAGVCSIAGSTVSFTGAGTCEVDANQAGDSNWNAAPQVFQSFGVGPGSQSISFTTSPPASAVVGGATYTPAATATSGLPVTITIDVTSAGICSISGGIVSFIGAGTCQIDANQAGNANYNPSPQATQSFLVGKGTQVITFTSTVPAAAKVDGPTYTVTATGGASGNPVVFTIDPSSTSGCSIAGSVVTFNAPIGTCVIDADQLGNSNYNAAPTAQQSFSVGIGDQTISFTSTAPSPATVGGPTYAVTATATSGLTVTFSIDPTTTSICSINTVTNTVSFQAVGTCLIDADQAGDSNYNPAPQAQQSVTVAQGSQTISFTSIAPATAKVSGPTYTVTATATSGLPVTFTLDAASTGCSLAGNVVSFTAVGTCKVDANQSGNANYTAAAQQQQSFPVAKGDQTITFTSTPPPGVKVNDPTYTVTATGGASGNPVTFTIDATATGICSIVGSTVSFNAGGTCVIDANQAGNANYNAATQVQQSFLVAKLDQTITITSSAPASAKVGGATYTVTATASSGLTVTFSAGSTACNVAGSTVSFVHATTCTVNADQAGNAQYNAAPQVQQSFAVAKGDQTINVSSSAPPFGSTTAAASPHTYAVTATATSGLPVAITIDVGSTSGACSVAGSTVTYGANPGTCLIDANQAGNADWNPATQVQQSTTVEIPATAVNDGHNVTGNVAIAAGTGVMSNDTGTNISIKSYGATTGLEQTTIGNATATAQGGSVTLVAAGTYNYDPPANFTGTDTFKYIIGNDLAATSTGTVTLTISDRIMVVATSGVGAADCKPQSACTLATADSKAAVTSGKDLVFVESGTYNSAVFSLLASQNIVGQKVALSPTALTDVGITLAAESVTAPITGLTASTTPTLNNSVTVLTLNTNNLVEYFAINPSGGSAILGNAIGSGTDTIHDIAITGTSGGIGFNLTNNNGATFNISNIGVSTATGSAFSATGAGPAATTGGTVNVTGAVNTLSAAGGVALNIVNTTIGASGLNFKSIAATGAASGIVLNNTGAGSLAVAGDGTNVNNGSGGTLQSQTGDAISLNSTSSPSFNQISIQSTTHNGIKGTSVVGFTLTNSTIANSGVTSGGAGGVIAGTGEDSNVNFATHSGGTENNLSGVVTVTGNTLSNGLYGGLYIYNFAGTISNATVSNNTVSSSTVTPNSLGSGIQVVAFGSASGVSSWTKATFDNNTITHFPSGAGISFQGGNATSAAAPAGSYGDPTDTAASPTNAIRITNNTINGNGVQMNTDAILATIGGTGTGNFYIASNGQGAMPLGNTNGIVIAVQNGGTGQLRSTITNNKVVANNVVGSRGISVSQTNQFSTADAPTFVAIVTNNVVSNTNGAGMILLAAKNNGVLKGTFTGNTVGKETQTVAEGAILLESGDTSATTNVNTTVCVTVNNNTATGGTNTAGTQTAPGIGVRLQANSAPNSNTFHLNINGFGFASGTVAQMESYVGSQNPSSNCGTFGTCNGGGAYAITNVTGYGNTCAGGF